MSSQASASRRLVLAVGNFFFRYRNAAFPIIFMIAILVCRPRVIINPQIDRLLVMLGMVVAFIGQGIRMLTIGFDYIERGGKNRQIYASFLAQKGLYALTRNPMYLGNVLIAIGMTMIAGSPSLYAIVLPCFLVIYASMIVAEETYLQSKFGPLYEHYCAQVPRWWPRLSARSQAFEGMTYHWRRALRKDLSTFVGVCTGVILFPVWRTYFLEGLDAAKATLWVALSVECGVLVFYWLMHELKKRKVLLYLPTEHPSLLR